MGKLSQPAQGPGAPSNHRALVSHPRADRSAYTPEHLLPSLLPCPFCGAAAVRERHPGCGEILRIACANEGCRVMPRTEYLLTSFADELWTAWNARAVVRADYAGQE